MRHFGSFSNNVLWFFLKNEGHKIEGQTENDYVWMVIGANLAFSIPIENWPSFLIKIGLPCRRSKLHAIVRPWPSSPCRWWAPDNSGIWEGPCLCSISHNKLDPRFRGNQHRWRRNSSRNHHNQNIGNAKTDPGLLYNSKVHLKIQFCTSHNVRKSQEKSHSTLRAKRATFTFWVNKT